MSTGPGWSGNVAWPRPRWRYENTARRFLQQRAVSGAAFEPAALTGVDVDVFLLAECARVSTGSAMGRVAELRSVLRVL